MNFQQILFSVLSVVLTTVATWAVARLTAWLDSKIKDKTALGFLNDAIQIVQTVVSQEASKRKSLVNVEKRRDLYDVTPMESVEAIHATTKDL